MISKDTKIRMESAMHFMIDIEALSTRHNSIIKSIGIVAFDIKTGEQIDLYSTIVDIDSCVALGGIVDEKTIAWWFNQSPEAQKIFKVQGTPISIVLNSINIFFKKFKKYEKYYWANSPGFDLNIIKYYCEKLNVKIPWVFWKEIDFRTLKTFYPEVEQNIVFEGEKHNALDDCKYQIKVLSDIYNKM